MWWPITGKAAGGAGGGSPAISTGRFRFGAAPLDIEALNRRAAERGDLDVTALSARAYADVADRYVLTACGASFGEGYGPKVVCGPEAALTGGESLRQARVRIAVPGARTTAFLVLSLLIGGPFEFVEMPFDRIIGAVVRGDVDAGLIIHEGQLTFVDAGLREVVDLGRWWMEETGLPLPLGVNAVRRDLDVRFGAGTVTEVARTLAASVRYALEHRDEGLEYARRFAMANLGGELATPERVERFVGMYVNGWTMDMGDGGRRAISALLSRGADHGLCPRVGRVESV
jgi:1,4-dihydroxy-6-naphthoate synthase